jgi:hypothetical protein
MAAELKSTRNGSAAKAVLLMLLGLAAAPAARAQAAGGRIVALQGEVLVDGTPAQAGMHTGPARLKTGTSGRVQWRADNGALIALPPGSELQFAADGSNSLSLLGGGLRLSTAGGAWRVDLPGRSIRTNGYLKLQPCDAACTLPAGLYGRIAQGEAVLEYQGGRAVMRERAFRWPDARTRPETLTSAPALLDEPGNLDEAARARIDVAAELKAGLDAFRDGQDAAATQALENVARAAPGETLVPYYQGLIALRHEDNAAALRLLQQYAQVDPEGAAAREVPKTLTLLSSTQLQQEVASAVARETEVASSPPEPGSIAVQAFVNHGNEAYRAMAKGLAAMIIADLSKVPGLKVLEREKVQLLVNEARLGDSGLTDTASAVRSGRLMRAEKVVVGNFEVQ